MFFVFLFVCGCGGVISMIIGTFWVAVDLVAREEISALSSSESNWRYKSESSLPSSSSLGSATPYTLTTGSKGAPGLNLDSSKFSFRMSKRPTPMSLRNVVN